MRIFLTVFLILFTSNFAQARPVIADLSLRTIEINSSFTGTEILLFGARNDAGDIVVVIRGPEISYMVRKKERNLGMWVNKDEAVFKNANGFYTVAANRPIDKIQNDNMISVLGIGIENLHFDIKGKKKEIPEFKQAFIDYKQNKKLFSPIVEEVSFIGDTLFRTIIKFPDNIPRGTYTAEVYLFSDGQLVGMQSTPLSVYKKGFDAVVFDFAYNYPAIYGIIAVLVALAGGWIAGAIFRKV